LKSIYVDVPLLEAQETYFVYTETLITWVNYDGRRKAGTLSTPSTPEPPQISKPPLHTP
jgi:hypothetical protein